jgi:hypothetical protein
MELHTSETNPFNSCTVFSQLNFVCRPSLDLCSLLLWPVQEIMIYGLLIVSFQRV